MDFPRPFVFIVLLLFLSIAAFLPSASSSPSDDINSLLEFKKGIVDPSGSVLSSWASSPNTIQSCPSTWVGITCDPTSGGVIGLNLTNLNLSGELKLTTLTGLRYLQTLVLAGNGFTGRLVPVLGSMPALAYIDLSGNQFYGSIPDKITDLSGLVYLNLSSNKFTQGYPAGFSKLQNLRVLDLNSNGIWGDIGGLLTELRNTEHVDLGSNLFTGEITIDPSNLTSLGNTVKYFNLSSNKIQGGFFLESTVQIFRNLEILDLGYNALTGELPSISSWFNLKVLRLEFNRFFGLLPREIFQSSMGLVEIDLSGDTFTGSIPVINSTTLKSLNLSSNSLSGPLPRSISGCASLDLSNNMLNGDLTLIQNWGGSLQALDLSSNVLSGTYPQNLANLQNLISLKIHNNSLTGPLPSVLGTYSKLLILDLSSNKLTGPILPGLFTLLTLTSLNLSGNGFTGSIPVQSSQSPESLALPSYTHLDILDLSNNALNGPIPPEMGNMQKLRILNLAINNFAGPIPTEMTNLTALQYLDLSKNQLNGSLPDFSQRGLYYFDVSNNDLSGKVPKSLLRFPDSSFIPGNSDLIFPDGLPSSVGTAGTEPRKHKKMKHTERVALIVACGGCLAILILVSIGVYLFRKGGSCQNCFGGKFSGTKEVVLGASTFGSPKDGSALNGTMVRSRLMTARRDVSAESIGVAELAPVSHVTIQVHEEPPVMLERGASFSPDRLDGDLTLVDGSTLFGPEELSKAPAEILGRSSHGTTYKATLDNGHELTVKWLRVGFVKTKKEFAKEAKRVGSVRHPNLVGWKGFYWGPKVQERFIISDYLLGDSLALYLYESTPRRYSRLSVSQRLKISIDLARALHYLHHKKIPHGNIKPTNVLLTGPDLTAKLTDFGLHCLMTPEGVTEQILNSGALGYRAPELADGSGSKPALTLKADVYSFGVIVMEMLTRKSAGDIISGQSGAVDLTDWVQLCNKEGRGNDCFDRDITGLEENSRVMDQLLVISLNCIGELNERPDIKSVLDALCSITI